MLQKTLPLALMVATGCSGNGTSQPSPQGSRTATPTSSPEPTPEVEPTVSASPTPAGETGTGGFLRAIENPRVADQCPAHRTFHVSTSGNDANDGLSEAAPFKTLAKVNGLALQKCDRVLLRCGDVWRGERLQIKSSGAANEPITFSSYPARCDDKPVLSGSHPVSGWTLESGNIWVASLDTGDNQGKFPGGVNQLFRNGERLTFGRWPNLTAANGGYSSVTSSSGNSITDANLPGGIAWTGAVVHLKGMRWYMVNRKVTGSSSTTLTFDTNPDCWGGNCTGWGYFIQNHKATLDSEGEWFYDAATRKLSLWSSTPPGNGIEASAVRVADTANNPDRDAGIVVGGAPGEIHPSVHHVIISNFEIRNQPGSGIAHTINNKARRAESNYDPQNNISIHGNRIVNPDKTGILWSSWIIDMQTDADNGWTGGFAIELTSNEIRGANHFGIDSMAYDSFITNNVIRDVALAGNLGYSGMGCGFSGSNCTENGDGIRLKTGEKTALTSHHVTVSHNSLERVGYTGIDVFGRSHTLERNVIRNACHTKGDCGGIRTFGNSNAAATQTRDIVIRENHVADTLGVNHGNNTTYQARFGFGIYVDMNSLNVLTQGNLVEGSTAAGILYQHSTGAIKDNLVVANGIEDIWTAQVNLTDGDLSELSGNHILSLHPKARTLSMDANSTVTTSNGNSFVHSNLSAHIVSNGTTLTLAQWRNQSGKDTASNEGWFTDLAGNDDFVKTFFNATTAPASFNPGEGFYTLRRVSSAGTTSHAPFTGGVWVSKP